MRAPYYSKQFERDVKLHKKRGKNLEKLKEILELLIEGKPLSGKHKEHPLSGDFSGYLECHIESDWLLIYKLEDSIIYFIRTGTHSDLFG